MIQRIDTTATALTDRLAAVRSEIKATPTADLDDDHPLFTERDAILDLVEALPADTFAALAAKAAAYRSIHPNLQGRATDERLLIQIFDALAALAIDGTDQLADAA